MNGVRPLLLDLFCGAGGAAMGYYKAGWNVIGVDITDQPHYPFKFYQLDALKIKKWSAFQAIHASPPCQRYTAYKRSNYVYERPEIIPIVREMLRNSGLPYVIENVPGAPLENPIVLCGSSFGLNIRRHRLFESNINLTGLPCKHSWQTPRFPSASNRKNLRSTVEIGVGRIPMELQKQAMGIDWMPRRALSQAIPPAYTEFIGKQLLGKVKWNLQI